LKLAVSDESGSRPRPAPPTEQIVGVCLDGELLDARPYGDGRLSLFATCGGPAGMGCRTAAVSRASVVGAFLSRPLDDLKIVQRVGAACVPGWRSSLRTH
jgi:hypothetical protein